MIPSVIARAVLSAVGLMALVVAASPAQAGWLPPHTFATVANDNIHEPIGTTVANSRGEALVAWSSFDGISDGVFVADRPSGGIGGWEHQHRLSNVGANAHYPRIALDSAANAAVVWTVTYSDWYEEVEISIRLGPTGTWSQPARISPPNEWSELCEIAFDDAGNLTAVWANIAHHAVQSAVYSTISHTWTAPQILSTGDLRSAGHLAVAPSGRAVVAWSTAVGNGNVVPRASVRASRTAAWAPERDLTSVDGYASVNDVAIDSSGQALVVWDRFRATTDYLEVATLPAGSLDWGPAVRLSRPGTNGHNGQVALDAYGNAFASWARDIDLNQNGIEVSTRTAGEDTWAAPESIAEDAIVPSLTLDAVGDAIVVYSAYGTIKARLRSAQTGTWGPPSDLSDVFDLAYPGAAAVEPSRGALVLWQTYSQLCSCFSLQGADYVDGLAPRKRALAN